MYLHKCFCTLASDSCDDAMPSIPRQASHIPATQLFEPIAIAALPTWAPTSNQVGPLAKALPPHQILRASDTTSNGSLKSGCLSTGCCEKKLRYLLERCLALAIPDKTGMLSSQVCPMVWGSHWRLLSTSEYLGIVSDAIHNMAVTFPVRNKFLYWHGRCSSADMGACSASVGLMFRVYEGRVPPTAANGCEFGLSTNSPGKSVRFGYDRLLAISKCSK